MRGGGNNTGTAPVFLVLLLLLSIIIPYSNHLAEEDFSIYNASTKDPPVTFQNTAVPDGFNQSNYLDYSDVGVLINNKSSVSQTIGWAFVNARNISLDHVFFFDLEGTPTAETINRDQFDTYFADPYRVWIGSNNRTLELNYLVTTKGVPLRINGDGKASFDSEIGLIGGLYDGSMGNNWWTTHGYGPLAGKEMESFSRVKYGFFLVTRLTGYTVDTALGLIDKASSSLGERGQFVLDLAANRNGSGYKYWNDDLYTANTSLNGTRDLPVFFNQNSTFVTNQTNVMGYASWGSNDGAWGADNLQNSGFETLDNNSNTMAQHWQSTLPSLSSNESFTWNRSTDAKRSGTYGLLGELWPDCSNTTNGSGNNTTTTTTCLNYSNGGNSNGDITMYQFVDINEELRGHTWYVSGYGRKVNDIGGWWQFIVSGMDDNGTTTSPPISSSTRSFRDGWDNRWVRFSLPENATKIMIQVVSHFNNGSAQGEIHFDSFILRSLRPDFEWINGSIVETAVSTGGRSFNSNTGYGQSLVADILESGASATKGYVYEPYLTAVSYPSILLSSYADGYTMAESYYAANTFVSWMGVVVGDPKMSAYSDVLHDVTISSPQANGTLTAGNSGDIIAIVENLAPGEAKGTIEVRDKQGNLLVGNLSLSLPAGDMPGSRVMVSIPITPTRGGYVEFDIRWTNSSEGGFPERIKDNNAISLNVLINQIPIVLDAWCASSQIERGDSFACFATSEDDDSVSGVKIAWRLFSTNQNNSNWTWNNATKNSGWEWWTVFDSPVDIGLGNIELAVIATDSANSSSLIFIIGNVSEIINAVPRWYGIHVETVDDPLWGGSSNLATTPPNGLLRGRQVELRGCSIDADHDPISEWPQFAASKGVVGSVTIENQIEEGVTCYKSTWILPIGGDLQPVQLELWSDGVMRNGRSILISDLAPTLEINLLDGSTNQSIDFSSGARDYVWLIANDFDDPDTPLSGDLLVTWPGMLTLTLPVNMLESGVGTLIQLPAAEAGLEIGDLLIEFVVNGAHGATGQESKTWPVILTLPTIIESKICDAEGATSVLTKGSPAALYIHLNSSREFGQYRVDIEQTGWSTGAPLLSLSTPPWSESPPVGCEADSSLSASSNELLMFRLLVDNNYAGGEALVRIRIVDLDGLSVSRNIPITIAHSSPEVTIITEQSVELGEPLDVSIIVLDADGIDSVRCDIYFMDSKGAYHSQANGQPDNSGEINIIHQTADYGENESITISASCRDETGNIGNNTTLSPIVILSAIDENPDENPDENVLPNEQRSSGAVIIASSGLLMAIFVILGLLYYRRNKLDVKQVVESQSKAWVELDETVSETVEVGGGYASTSAYIPHAGEPSATPHQSEIEAVIVQTHGELSHPSLGIGNPAIENPAIENPAIESPAINAPDAATPKHQSEVSSETEAHFASHYEGANNDQNDFSEILDDLL